MSAETTKRFLGVCLFILVAGGGALLGFQTVNQAKQISSLEGRLANSEAALRSELDGLKSSLRDSAATAETKQQTYIAEVASINKRIKELATPPDSESVAEAIFRQNSEAIANAIASQIVSNQDYADLLRGPAGRDADPKLIVAELTSSGGFNQLVSLVAEEIWAVRKNNILYDREFVATIATEANSKYKAEIVSREKELARLIASELAREPSFAALVAASHNED